MKRKLFIIIAFLSLLSACNRRPSRLEQALALAGENRTELEKVLHHYRSDPADTLKYRAACFLIENMIGHHEVMPDHTVKPDLKYITCDYMIRNIDISFVIWENVPCRDAITFDDFCEEILPYRVGNEAPEDWKETYRRNFGPVIDSIQDRHDIREICRKLHDFLRNQHWAFVSDFHSPGLGPLTLLENRQGSCKEQTEFMTCILRSLGIPAYIDRIVQNANHHYQAHYWNYIREPGGNRLYVDSYNVHDEIEDFSRDRRYGKIYRTYFKLQPASLPFKMKGEPVPPTLASPFLADVSHEYFPHVNITIELNAIPAKGEILFLDVFNGRQWMPTGWVETDRRKKRVRFCHVEPNVLYMVSTIRKRERIPLTEPFILKGNENARFLHADTTKLQEMNLTRKFRTTGYWPERLGKAVGGKFQGAGRADFSDAVTLYEITDTASLGTMTFPVYYTEKFRYVRYISPDSVANRIAELRFLSKGEPLLGAIICPDGQHRQGKENIIDNNPLTSFNLKEPGNWIGFALESPRQIDEIRFQYWNDDNSIRRNDEYELFYWANDKWNSLGRQTGSDIPVLTYKNCPANALFLLSNHTHGREERPFTYENGKQIFW